MRVTNFIIYCNKYAINVDILTTRDCFRTIVFIHCNIQSVISILVKKTQIKNYLYFTICEAYDIMFRDEV